MHCENCKITISLVNPQKEVNKCVWETENGVKSNKIDDRLDWVDRVSRQQAKKKEKEIKFSMCQQLAVASVKHFYVGVYHSNIGV